ncbi:nuclear transport factor 2 family protein [Rahnella aceris]|uniref:nuclear transport factor 2 family protein n=1 Tax=Rahnella sp. (strain Y9602) TaxID=2703885 RepID=UPI001905882D|nr:nuclear transport factor 2 family protein [Rahnella aceris]QQN37395.1 nuclear transport factor 2 family protein [Rahnella aceris]UNK55496.1 nuclear transport factor 2 family protein [Rahnella aceris]
MNNTDLYERLAIHGCQCHFQSAFDLMDWQLMEDCLWPELYVDYSSFRNDPPRFMTQAEYIALRQAALSKLKMQHSFTNLTRHLSRIPGKRQVKLHDPQVSNHHLHLSR